MSETAAAARRLEAIGVSLHGVGLTLEVGHPPLAAYAREHLGPLAGPPVPRPDLVVTAHWSEGDEEPDPLADGKGFEVIGKRMRARGDRLEWLDPLTMKGLRLGFRREDGIWRFDVHYRYKPKPPERARPNEEYKRYFSLMSYLVYYPLAWWLERARGLVVLHGSALAAGPGGIVIGGVGGVGKTTTCIALLRRPGIRLLSENLVFTDGEAVYPCPEPVRLDPASVALLGGPPDVLAPMSYPDGLKDKELYHALVTWKGAIEPRAIVLPVFSERRGRRPLAPGVAAEKLIAMNRLTRELDDLDWYAAALDLRWPEPGASARRIETLHRLAARARCFELGIDRAAGVEAVVEDVLGALE